MKTTILSLVALFAIHAAQAQIKPGTSVKSVTVSDADKNAKAFELGGKPTVFYYIDPDASSVNDPLSDEMKSRTLPRDRFTQVAVVNAKDTWIPTATIRSGVRKNNKPNGPLILIDEDKTVANAWGLGDCNNTCILMIIGKDNKVKFVRYIKSKDDSRKAMEPFFAVLNAEVGA
jgi:predicted transcriptional regulator